MKQTFNLLSVLPAPTSVKASMRWLPLIAGIWLLLWLLMAGILHWRNLNFEHQLARTAKNLEVQKAYITDIEKKFGGDQATDRLELLHEFEEKTQALSTLMADQTAQTLFSEELLSFSENIPTGVWLTHITLADSGNQIRLVGHSLTQESVLAFLKKLNASEVLDQINFQVQSIQQKHLNHEAPVDFVVVGSHV